MTSKGLGCVNEDTDRDVIDVEELRGSVLSIISDHARKEFTHHKCDHADKNDKYVSNPLSSRT